MCILSPVSLFATPWTVAHQAPLSMVFSRQEHWSGLPFPHPGDFPDPGIQSRSLVSPELPGGSDGKESARNTGGVGSIPGLGRSPEEGNSNPLQYSCLENSMDTWQHTVHGVAKNGKQLSK